MSTDMYTQLREIWQQLIAPGAPFEVTEIDVRGNPMKVYAGAPPSLREVWLSSAQFADREYITYRHADADIRWTYADTHDMVARLAAWMARQGIKPGDRVAIAMRNYPEYMPIYWACVASGVAVVGMNAWWVTNEMEYGLTDAAPKVMFADAERLQRFESLRDKFPDLPVVGVRLPASVAGVTDFADTIATPGELPDVTVDPDADACIFYTSGTTGFPKGAQLTHRGCVHNLMNLGFAGALQMEIAVRAGDVDPAALAAGPQPSALVTTPLFHVTANNCVAHGMTANGGKLVHMYKWDAGDALALIESERVTSMTGVPTMARELIAHPDFATRDTSTLATLGGGGAQLQPDLVGKIDESVATARPNTGYGMTETCGIITSISADIFVDRPESAGPAMPVFDTRLVDDDGNHVPDGGVGELWVRGAPVIKGYLNRPEATAESITDGWLHTGDVARIDADGFIYIVDRKKDMVLRGGENVYCAEVESAMFDHPAVAECAVFGVPDERLGEEVGAALHLKPGASVSADELRQHCTSQIARHKIPRYIWFTDEPLPRNASGKFVKGELRDMLGIEDAA